MVDVSDYKAYANFTSTVLDAAELANTRSIEAHKAGNTTLARDLAAQSKALKARYFELSDARQAELTSAAPKGTASAISRMRTINSNATDALMRLKNLADALKNASEILDMATRFIKLF